MSTQRVALGSLDLGELLVVIRSADPVGDVSIVTSTSEEAAVLDRFVAGAGARTVLLDDRLTGELSVLVPSVQGVSAGVPPVLVLHGDVGSSATLRQVLGELPGLLQCAVVVSYAHAAWARSLTLSVLRRSSVLPVEELRGRTELHPGVVYLAPPLGHAAALDVQAGALVALEAPDEPRIRVAADRLLRSAAGVVPTTVLLLDGIAQPPLDGLRAVRVAGGRIVAGVHAERAAAIRQAADAGLLDAGPTPVAVREVVERVVGDDLAIVTDEFGSAPAGGDRPS
ncbi:MAG: chemotaxis protein CheB [Nitriliruptoraceae bacterium]